MRYMLRDRKLKKKKDFVSQPNNRELMHRLTITILSQPLTNLPPSQLALVPVLDLLGLEVLPVLLSRMPMHLQVTMPKMKTKNGRKDEGRVSTWVTEESIAK